MRVKYRMNGELSFERKGRPCGAIVASRYSKFKGIVMSFLLLVKAEGRFFILGNKKETRIIIICMSALCAALSIILGKFLAVGFLTWRISFESLPIILCSLLFGPLAGMSAGFVADFTGCLLVGYEINPIITAGCTLMGFFPWIISKHIKGRKGVFAAVILSHLVCSVVVKTVGILLYYGGGTAVVITRILNYAVVSLAEAYLTYFIYSAMTKRGIKK